MVIYCSGIVFYIIVAVLYSLSNNRYMRIGLLVAATGGMMLSGYLAYVMTSVIKRICLVCALAYISNSLVFLAALSVYWDKEGYGKVHLS